MINTHQEIKDDGACFVGKEEKKEILETNFSFQKYSLNQLNKLFKIISVSFYPFDEWGNWDNEEDEINSLKDLIHSTVYHGIRYHFANGEDIKSFCTMLENEKDEALLTANSQIELLVQRNKELKEALEFFADDKNYEYYETFENEEHPDDRYLTTKVLEFGLEKAQQALAIMESKND